jgi:hypothetical protein
VAATGEAAETFDQFFDADDHVNSGGLISCGDWFL